MRIKYDVLYSRMLENQKVLFMFSTSRVSFTLLFQSKKIETFLSMVHAKRYLLRDGISSYACTDSKFAGRSFLQVYSENLQVTVPK